MLREKKISEKQLEKALHLQEESQVLLGEILIQLDYISAEELEQVLAKQEAILFKLPTPSPQD